MKLGGVQHMQSACTHSSAYGLLSLEYNIMFLCQASVK